MKKWQKFSSRIGALVWLLNFAAANASPSRPDSTLHFDLDSARFSVNDTTVQVEVYIAVPRAALHFTPRENQLQANFLCQVVINKNGVDVMNHQWRVNSTANDSSELKAGQLLFTQSRFQLTVGTYRFYVRVLDLHSQHAGVQAFQMAVEPYPLQQLAMSDLQLAARLERDTTQSLFHKNHYLVLPNPSALYGLELPMLYFYTEIYNLHFPSDSSYSTHYRILNGEGNAVKALPSKRRKIAGTKLVEVGGFNIVTMKSGSYALDVRVVDHTNGAEASRRHKFFVYREKDQTDLAAEASAAGLNFLAQNYRQMPEKALNQEFETTRYISSNEEKKIFNALKLEGKREFIARFWQKRDQSPETPQNEYRDQYLNLVAFANKNFAGFRAGWKTDMGRVLLMYGHAEEIERFPNSNDARAYQIWHYFQIEGGVEFVFVETRSGGEMELVHSTARNELQDPTWQRWLNPGR